MAHFFLAAKELGSVGKWDVAGFDAVQVAEQRSIPKGYEVLGIYRE
jgi:hypothetical protein